jgi:hypothetical protein
MLRATNNTSFSLIVAGVLTLVCGSCGGSSSNTPSGNNLSQAQAQAVTGEVSLALAQALGSAFTVAASPEQRTLPAIVEEIHPDASLPSCTATSAGEDCNWPISYSGACPQGGTISVAGDINGGQINFTQSAPSFPITLSETGGLSYGPNPSGSCQFNLTYSITSTTACTITGTACGQPVTGPC